MSLPPVSMEENREAMLIFIKLGGSLITNKAEAHQPRRRLIRRLLLEIRSGLESNPDLRIVLGHGSGSFGHVPAKKYGTITGVHTRREWDGFIEVWREARALNLIVMEEAKKSGLNAIAFAPSASILTEDRRIIDWNISPIQLACESSILPVIHGDVIFDRRLGGTILSTEDLFFHLAPLLKPSRILLAGVEKGVWASFPERDHLIPRITPAILQQSRQKFGGSQHTDVTGGMQHKVSTMVSLVEKNPELSISIFSGLISGVLGGALQGEYPGTTIQMDY